MSDNTSTTYAYDAMGKLLTATNSNATLTFAYDTLGRVKSFTDGRLNKTITYEYDKNDSRTKMIDAEGRITKYAYNPLNLLTSITNPSGKIFNFTYDALGRKTGLTYPNGINAAYAYDPASQLTELANKLSATQITKNAYTYDVVGNRVTNTDLAGAHNYQYDTTYQLINATHPTITEAFTYDKNGNRKTETKGTTAINYTHTAGNRIQTKDGETYTHDKNGNIISDLTSAGTTTYTYDYENRLIGAVMPDGTIAEYKYDPFGRRIEKAVTASGATTITRYLYDGFNILAEYDENNNLKTKYTHNIGIDDPLAMERSGNIYYYHKDALGSITAIIDESGNIVQQYKYDSFGNITYIKDSTFIQPYTFTGREFDPETGLMFYRSRTFNPKLGTFIQEDPIGFAAGDVNLFRYVGNSPQNWIDPFGLFMLSVKYSEKPYGSVTMVWNNWLPQFYTSTTRGDNGAEINSGIYKYQYGQHPMNPQNGKKPYPALNLYTRDGNRCIPGTKLDKKGNTINANVCGVNVHKGYRPKTGSQGCHVIPKENWSDFISNFESGDEGTYVYIRF